MKYFATFPNLEEAHKKFHYESGKFRALSNSRATAEQQQEQQQEQQLGNMMEGLLPLEFVAAPRAESSV